MHPAAHVDPVAAIVLWVSLIFLAGVVGRYLAQRLKQPGVLGELLMGVLVGNIAYQLGMPLFAILREGFSVFGILPELFAGEGLRASLQSQFVDPKVLQSLSQALSGSNANDLLKVAYVVDIFSRYGIILLLFMAGLESSVSDLKNTGTESLRVAILGVVMPILFGMLLMLGLAPKNSLSTDFFVAATLAATSIGITARILKEEKKLRTREARTILGAAMLDDILGLMILSVASGIVLAGRVNWLDLLQILLQSLLFFTATLYLGPKVLRAGAFAFRLMEPWEAKLFISFVFAMLLSYLACLAQLATIIGAFAAGIILHDGLFEQAGEKRPSQSIKNLVAPLEFILAPLFFMLIGIQVKLELFLNWEVLGLSLGLILVAILGKLISGFAANPKDDRLLIGIGMLPRGEVGLVFASIGKNLGVMSDSIFSAIVLMVFVTTMITPAWLKKRYAARTGVLRELG